MFLHHNELLTFATVLLQVIHLNSFQFNNNNNHNNKTVIYNNSAPFKFLNFLYHPAPTLTPARSQNIRNVSEIKKEIKKPKINPDAESIFLPINGNSYHPEKVLERIQTYTDHKNRNSNNLLNFDAYILKPFNFDYSKVFSSSATPVAQPLSSKSPAKGI